MSNLPRYICTYQIAMFYFWISWYYVAFSEYPEHQFIIWIKGKKHHIFQILYSYELRMYVSGYIYVQGVVWSYLKEKSLNFLLYFWCAFPLTKPIHLLLETKCSLATKIMGLYFIRASQYKAGENYMSILSKKYILTKYIMITFTYFLKSIELPNM